MLLQTWNSRTSLLFPRVRPVCCRDLAQLTDHLWHSRWAAQWQALDAEALAHSWPAASTTRGTRLHTALDRGATPCRAATSQQAEHVLPETRALRSDKAKTYCSYSKTRELGAGAELEGEKEVTFWMLMFWLDFCPTPQVEIYLNTEPHCGHHRHAQQERRGRDNGTHTGFFSNGQSGGGSFFWFCNKIHFLI